jgi:hypothetical protein
LTSVTLTNSTELSDVGVAALAACPLLRFVDLASCEDLADLSVTSLATCPLLERVELSERSIADEAAGQVPGDVQNFNAL